jgi:M6 family metalloprotease-like protein
VKGWYRMPHPHSYYCPPGTFGLGTFPNNTQQLTIDAVNMAADSGVNFSTYDAYPPGNPDGKVDGLFIVHAGAGYEETGDTTLIHSHKWELGYHYLVKNGDTINAFTVEPEESGLSHKISPIGVFCHEYGHFIGLVDLYDVEDNNNPAVSKGLGDWSLMATGSYNGGSQYPAHLDAWSKIKAGFAFPIEISANQVNVEIPQVETDPVIYKLSKAGWSAVQYFLVENRRRTLFDIGLPWDGLLIYHVDELFGDAYGNNAGIPYHVALEQADGLRQLETATNNRGDAGDPWPGALEKRSFDDLSTPSSRYYGPDITEISVWNISDPDSIMTANLDISWSRPHFVLDTAIFADANADGIFDPGEQVMFYFNLRNDWLTAHNATITLSSDDPKINFTTPSVFRAAINGDGSVTDNAGDPIIFTIPDSVVPRYDSFFVTVESDGGAFTAVFGRERQIGRAQVLVVDDDRGAKYDTMYVGDLYKKRVPSDVWEKKNLGSPPGAVLDNYHIVVWFTGDSATDYLQTADITAMKEYLDNGGNLFLTGQGLAGELRLDDSVFMDNYLHARFGGALFYFQHLGIAGSPIGDGLKVKYDNNGTQVFSLSQQIIPVNGALPAFKFSIGNNYSALSYAGAYKVVFFSWGYEAILNTNQPPSQFFNRDTVMANILHFFGDIPTDINDGRNPGVIPKSFVLEQNYPNPFNPITHIRYSIQNTGAFPIPNTVLKIYNVLGQEIRTLIDRKQIPGEYDIEWDGNDQYGNRVASGLYFYRISRGADKETKKMVLLK